MGLEEGQQVHRMLRSHRGNLWVQVFAQHRVQPSSAGAEDSSCLPSLVVAGVWGSLLDPSGDGFLNFVVFSMGVSSHGRLETLRVTSTHCTNWQR